MSDNKETYSAADDELIQSLFGDEFNQPPEFPLVEPPRNLRKRLYAISKNREHSSNYSNANFLSAHRWRRSSAIAASISVVVVLSMAGIKVKQHYQQAQQIKKASQDIALAFHYLNETSRYAQHKLALTLHSSINKAAVAPLLASYKSLNPVTDKGDKDEIRYKK